MQFPKHQPHRSEAYLASIRKKNCMCCGAPPPVDPHHMATGGMSSKCSDLFTVPLCRACHQRVTDGHWQYLDLRYKFTQAQAWRRVAEQIQDLYLEKGGSNERG